MGRKLSSALVICWSVAGTARVRYGKAAEGDDIQSGTWRQGGSLFDVIALLLVLTSCFGVVNRVLTRLPNTIGLLLMGLLALLALVAIEFAFPSSTNFEQMIELVRDIDFSRTFMNWMLGVLLFAGALQIDVSSLRERKWIVAQCLGTDGCLHFNHCSCRGLLGGLHCYWRARSIHLGTCVVLYQSHRSHSGTQYTERSATAWVFECRYVGESLFNDGVGVVLFTLLVAVATGGKDGSFSLANFFQLFLVEAVGGGVLGFVTGYIAYHAMRFIDDYSLKVMISLALATATYALAARLTSMAQSRWSWLGS